MSILSIIADRRDARAHSEADLQFLANGAANGSIPDYQLAAWLMAAYLNPLSEQETAWLTLAMAHSGETIDLTGLPKPWVDKHSTGGVGDKTSIVVLPILAACGLTVIKMSGRGLGITGGTVDKLGTVPGFRLDLSPAEMKEQARNIGIALTGQGPALAPADKTLYALRDVTETVSSIPLIVSSILSKKIAGGAEVIVLDVKCGSGAFMKTREEARRLADALFSTAKLCGLRIRIAISDMSQPLGSSIGNALEVEEALAILNPSTQPSLTVPSLRFRRLCVELASITLEAAGLASDLVAATSAVEAALTSGSAFDKAAQWFEAQGGPDPRTEAFSLPQAAVRRGINSDKDGFVSRIQCDAVGQAVLELGGGRQTKNDAIDPGVGVKLSVCVGSYVQKGDPLFTVYASSESALSKAAQAVNQAIQLDDAAVPGLDPVLETIG